MINFKQTDQQKDTQNLNIGLFFLSKIPFSLQLWSYLDLKMNISPCYPSGQQSLLLFCKSPPYLPVVSKVEFVVCGRITVATRTCGLTCAPFSAAEVMAASPGDFFIAVVRETSEPKYHIYVK